MLIRTDRLVLRPFVGRDAQPLSEILSAPGVLDFFPPAPPPTLVTARKMINRVRAEWDTVGYGLWAVEYRGKLAGRAGLQVIPETGETELDFIIAPPLWGQGLATEAGKASLRFGFETLGLSEVVGIVHPDNLASRRVLEKLGMKHRSHAEYFGIEVESYQIEAWSWVPPGRSTLD